MRVFGEPVAVLEDAAVRLGGDGAAAAAAAAGEFGPLERGVGVLAVDVLEVLGHVVEHAPVVLHLADVLHVVGEVALGRDLQLGVLGEDAPYVHGTRHEGAVAHKGRGHEVVGGFVEEGGDLTGCVEGSLRGVVDELRRHLLGDPSPRARRDGELVQEQDHLVIRNMHEKKLVGKLLSRMCLQVLDIVLEAVG